MDFSLTLGTKKVTVNGAIKNIGFENGAESWNVGVAVNDVVSGSFTITADTSSATIVADKIGGKLTVLDATLSGKISDDLEIVKKESIFVEKHVSHRFGFGPR